MPIAQAVTAQKWVCVYMCVCIYICICICIYTRLKCQLCPVYLLFSVHDLSPRLGQFLAFDPHGLGVGLGQ